MALSFQEVNSLPDILGSDRFLLYFPTLPGDAGEGKDLTLRHQEITLPPYEVGTVISKPYGWSVSHAGRRVQATEFNVSFVEDVEGTTLSRLVAWQDYCSGIRRAGGYLKNKYAVDAELQVRDTTGKVALYFDMRGIWPIRITPPPLTEESSPARVECDFSIDCLDFIAVSVGDKTYSGSNAINRGKSSLLPATSPGSLPFKLPISVPSLGLSINQTPALLSSLFGAINIGQNIAISPQGAAQEALKTISGLSSLLNGRISF
jgi:hypothetical protein